MNPKQLKPCDKTISYIVDENGKDVILTCNDITSTNDFRLEVIKRYNRYETLVSCLVIVSSFLLVFIIGIFLL